jgi:hypothetical protein
MESKNSNISNISGIKLNSKANEYFNRNFEIKNIDSSKEYRNPSNEPYRKELAPFN